MTSWTYLVRHAAAEGSHPQGDAFRALTPAGADSFAQHAAQLVPSMTVARIWCSPMVRARQTADILARLVGVSVVEQAALASGQESGSGVVALLLRAGAGTVLVGHNPEMAEAAASLGGRGAFAPGTVAAVSMGTKPSVAWVRSP
jgi:phosphohistidine phosphatase SixA